MTNGVLPAVLIALALESGIARAEGDHDHDLARDLFRHGEIRALSEILSVVHAAFPGDIVAVELVRVVDKWVYRFQVIDADGMRSTVDIDAKTEAVIHTESTVR